MTAMETSLRKRIDQLQAEKRALVEFYGEPDTWRERELVWTDEQGRRVSGTTSPAMLDGGRKAREAR